MFPSFPVTRNALCYIYLSMINFSSFPQKQSVVPLIHLHYHIVDGITNVVKSKTPCLQQSLQAQGDTMIGSGLNAYTDPQMKMVELI